jgi:hypothetical protein
MIKILNNTKPIFIAIVLGLLLSATTVISSVEAAKLVLSVIFVGKTHM